MKIDDVMDQVAAQLDGIGGLRCFAWPNPKVTPPAALVSYPESVTFDETYGRGMDRISLPVVLVVGKPSDRSTRDLVAVYCDGSGPASVKQVLESGAYSALHTLRVEGIEFDAVRIAGVDYLAAVFTLDIAGQGS